MAMERMNIKMKEGWGFALEFHWASANFSILDVGIHWHPKPFDGVVMTPGDFCTFRLGVYITIAGLGIAVGRFAKFQKA